MPDFSDKEEAYRLEEERARLQRRITIVSSSPPAGTPGSWIGAASWARPPADGGGRLIIPGPSAQGGPAVLLKGGE